MRSKVEYRRCGCGQLIGLRESCPRCASAARSRLHEAGIATMRGQEHCRHPEEQWHRNTDTCGLCGVALRKVRMATMQKRWEAEGAVAALFRYLSLFEPHRRALHFQVSFVSRDYAIAARADRHANKWKWPIGADEMAMYTPELHASLKRSADMLNELVEAGVLKLSEAIEAAKHEPPAVGAEVDYATALADMQRRSEARYLAELGACVYAWREGRMCYVYCNQYLGDALGVTDGKWVRVPDGASGPLSADYVRWIRDLQAASRRATRLPAIGAEVSWSEAKVDMQRRREARYNHRTLRMTSPGSEYAWGGGALVTRTGRR